MIGLWVNTSLKRSNRSDLQIDGSVEDIKCLLRGDIKLGSISDSELRVNDSVMEVLDDGFKRIGRQIKIDYTSLRVT